MVKRLRDFAPALRALDGGLTISGGEPMVQLAFTRGIFRGRKKSSARIPLRFDIASLCATQLGAVANSSLAPRDTKNQSLEYMGSLGPPAP